MSLNTPDHQNPAPEQATAPILKPSILIKMAYGLGQIPQSAGFDTALAFVFFYYTAVLGLSGGMVGAALALGLLFDALVDPVVGSYSDNVHSRLGRRLPLMIVATPFVALSIGLLFSPPGGAATWLVFGWLALTSLVVRSAISLFNVPYIALGAELAQGPSDRASVIAFRGVIGLFAAAAVQAGAFAFFFVGKEGLLRRAAYPGFGWAVAGVLTVGMVGCCLGIWRYAAGLPQPERDATPLWRRLPAEVVEIFGNRSFVTLFASAVVLYVAIGVNATLNNHAWVFIWRLPPQTIIFIAYGYILGILLGFVLAPSLQTRFEKKTLVMAGIGMLLLNWTVLQGLRALGLFTVTGLAAVAPQVINSAFAGIGVGLVGIVYPLMMADAADEHEVLFSRRREGLYFAGLGFAAKAAVGLGVWVAGVALDLIGFHNTPGQVAAVVLPEGMIVRLVLIWGPISALLGTVSLMIFTRYTITRRRQGELAAELREKRGQSG